MAFRWASAAGSSASTSFISTSQYPVSLQGPIASVPQATAATTPIPRVTSVPPLYHRSEPAVCWATPSSSSSAYSFSASGGGSGCGGSCGAGAGSGTGTMMGVGGGKRRVSQYRASHMTLSGNPDDDGDDTIRVASTPIKRPRVMLDTFEPIDVMVMPLSSSACASPFQPDPPPVRPASRPASRPTTGYIFMGQVSPPSYPKTRDRDRDISWDWDREKEEAPGWGAPMERGLSNQSMASNMSSTSSSSANLVSNTARISLSEHPPSRVTTPAYRPTSAQPMERTASGFSISSDLSVTPNYDLEDEFDKSLISDTQAAQAVYQHAESFHARNPDSQHERILRALIEPRNGDHSGSSTSVHDLDWDAIDSIFLAANEMFFGGCLTGRVKWDWSDRTSAQYMDHVIGTTVVRRAPWLPGGGYETLIVLSRPILRESGYSRRLAISTFLHELIHCFLFIKCGFRARLGGGHTVGFRDIANLIDDWAGPGKLHLRHMKADLTRFRDQTLAHEPEKEALPLSLELANPFASLQYPYFPPPRTRERSSSRQQHRHRPPHNYHSRFPATASSASIPHYRRGGSGVGSSSASSSISSASSSMSSISSIASFGSARPEDLIIPAPAHNDPNLGNFGNLFDFFDGSYDKDRTIRRSSSRRDRDRATSGHFAMPSMGIGVDVSPRRTQSAGTGMMALSSGTGGGALGFDTGRIQWTSSGTGDRSSGEWSDGWWYGGVQDKWEDCTGEYTDWRSGRL